MRVLIVEDDQFKQEPIEQVVRQISPGASIEVARSVQHAVQLVGQTTFDFIILDVALPSHETRPGGGQPISQPTGGVEVLLELSYDGRSDKVIIITQYPDIEYDGRTYPLTRARQVLAKVMKANIVEVIYFKDPRWRDQFRKAFG
jgi:DNA-binding NarL/FixJ family response regulator